MGFATGCYEYALTAAPAAGGLRPRVVAAIDQGTTSSRCLLFARDGAVVGSAQREHRQITPRPGWVEHDPVEIWDRTAEVVAGALNNGGLEGSAVAAVGITNHGRPPWCGIRQRASPSLRQSSGRTPVPPDSRRIWNARSAPGAFAN